MDNWNIIVLDVQIRKDLVYSNFVPDIDFQ